MRLRGGRLWIVHATRPSQNRRTWEDHVILTDNMPLALAITKGRSSSSQFSLVVLRVQTVCSAALPCKLGGQPPSQTLPTRHLGRNGLMLARPVRHVKKSSRRSPECHAVSGEPRAAIAAHSACAQRFRGRPLFAWRTKLCTKRRF